MEPSLETLPHIMRGARDAYVRMLTTVRAFGDDDMRAPSILPGWTRAHVVSHVARNADSHVGLLTAAEEGRIVEQYEGGAEGRAAGIAAGAERNAQTIKNDFEHASTELFALWDRLARERDFWSRVVTTNRGDKPAWDTAWSRWRELEIHHVDLGSAFRANDWPASFVDALLPSVAAKLGERLPPDTRVMLSSGSWRALAGGGAHRITVEGTRAELLAWTIGRERAAPLIVARTDDGRPAPLPLLAAWG